MDPDILTGSFGRVASLIAAVGALGTAAFGLVDATKMFWGGMSNAGFAFVERALQPFESALSAAVGPTADWRQILKAHWLNGRSKDEQKAIAKSLIRLGLSAESAAALSSAGRVNVQALSLVAAALDAGTPLSEQQLNVLGRFDTSVEALMDSAFERADQYYRNASKTLAAVISVVLAIIAGGVLFADDLAAAQKPTQEFWTLVGGYLGSRYFPLAIIVGVVAVPIAPVSKDIVSAIGTAVRAMKAAKG